MVNRNILKEMYRKILKSKTENSKVHYKYPPHTDLITEKTMKAHYCNSSQYNVIYKATIKSKRNPENVERMSVLIKLADIIHHLH